MFGAMVRRRRRDRTTHESDLTQESELPARCCLSSINPGRLPFPHIGGSGFGGTVGAPLSRGLAGTASGALCQRLLRNADQRRCPRKGDAWEESVVTEPERQCIPHPFHLQSPRSCQSSESGRKSIPTRAATWPGKCGARSARATHTMWMDGRPRPSKYAMHTWEGFTTGHWEGDTLVTFTDHIKVGYLRRNGIPTSDQRTVASTGCGTATLLTMTVIVYDPVLSDGALHPHRRLPVGSHRSQTPYPRPASR